jgi:hypothetical protein
MKTPSLPIVTLCVFALCYLSPVGPSGLAALIVDESYQGYSIGAITDNSVAGNATGISTANLRINGTNTASIVSGTMSYSNGSLSLNGGNQYLNLAGNNTSTGTLASTLASSIPVSGGSFYMSFLHRFTGGFNGGDIGYASFQTNAVNGSSTLMATGSNGNGSRTYLNGTNVSASSGFVSGQVNFFVVQYVTDGVNWTGANVWVNPTSSTLGAASYTVSGATGTSTMVAVAPLISGLDSGDSVDFDRLQIGTSAFDVIPEPSTWWLLAGAGTFVMVTHRRRTIV